jgi:hypothetical protein
MPIKAQLLIPIVCMLAGLLHAQEIESKWVEFPALNGRYSIRLHEGQAIGNCRFNHADLVDQQNKKILFAFGPEQGPNFDLGGYENDSVVWSPKSGFVAVYTHSHRVGEPLVLAVSGTTIHECEIPEITLPHDKDPKNSGRHVQDWLKPIRWISETQLSLEDSGLIQQQRANGARITYLYDFVIEFAKDGKGMVKTLKQRKFSREPYE